MAHAIKGEIHLAEHIDLSGPTATCITHRITHLVIQGCVICVHGGEDICQHGEIFTFCEECAPCEEHDVHGCPTCTIPAWEDLPLVEPIERCTKHNYKGGFGSCPSCYQEWDEGPFCDDCRDYGHEAGTADCPFESQ